MTTNKASLVSPERMLIARAQTGDAEAFAVLMNTHGPRVLRTALRIVRNLDDAQDVAQQAFTAAWVNLDKFRGDSTFSTWLTRITMNEGLSVLRRRKHQCVELDDHVANAGGRGATISMPAPQDPEEALLKKEARRIVRQSLCEVKPAYRQAMRLRLLEDLSLEEIAGRLEIPVNTVKVHLYRGRQAMKEYLTQRLGRAA